VYVPRQIERAGDRVRLDLDEHERLLLRELVDDLAARLTEPDDKDLRRLFPPAYSDPADEEQYRSLVGDQLLDGRAKAIKTVSDTLGNETLDLEQADQWLRALNDLRLVLGTRLDVGEEIAFEQVDASDPRGRDLLVYGYLSWLQEQLVDALQPASGR
jgi:hypothetical protein